MAGKEGEADAASESAADRLRRQLERRLAKLERSEVEGTVADMEKSARFIGVLARGFTLIAQYEAVTERLGAQRDARRAERASAAALAGGAGMSKYDDMDDEALERVVAELERKMDRAARRLDAEAVAGVGGEVAAAGALGGAGRDGAVAGADA